MRAVHRRARAVVAKFPTKLCANSASRKGAAAQRYTVETQDGTARRFSALLSDV